MNDIFETAEVAHVSTIPSVGSAATNILSSEDFLTAIDEISSWPGYAATPLHNLSALAQELVDLSRFSAAPSARLSHLSFEGDRAFPT